MFISNAFAAPAAAGGTDVLSQFLPLIIIFVLFFFMIIRPQMKRAKETRSMLDALAKNDEVVTSGGLLGKVINVGDTSVSLEIAPNVVVQVQKTAIQLVMPKGAAKTAG
jgi:preprotein translocase subunit YajC